MLRASSTPFTQVCASYLPAGTSSPTREAEQGVQLEHRAEQMPAFEALLWGPCSDSSATVVHIWQWPRQSLGSFSFVGKCQKVLCAAGCTSGHDKSLCAHAIRYLAILHGYKNLR